MSDSLNLANDAINVNSPKQRFTGYFIPVELTKLGLTKQEQFLLAMIDSLDSGEPHFCYASNEYLAEKMELSLSRVSYYITKLKRLNLIKEVSFTGRTRRLMVLKENWYKPVSKKESCVKASRQTTRLHAGRLRENKKSHIYREDDMEEQQQQNSGKPSFAGSVVVVPSLAKLNEDSVTEHDKKRLSSKYSEEIINNAIAAVKQQGAPESFLKSLNAACKGQWKPSKTSKSTETENKKYAKDITRILNVELVYQKGYNYDAASDCLQIVTRKGGAVFHLDYKDPDFKRKLDDFINKKLKDCFYD